MAVDVLSILLLSISHFGGGTKNGNYTSYILSGAQGDQGCVGLGPI